MDDINRLMQQKRRAEALREQSRHEEALAEREARAEEPSADRPAPAGAGRLRLERRQGEWRYYLGEHRVRVGDPLEFYVSPTVGWVRGTFQWGRRNTSPPTFRLPVVHPDDPDLFLGEMVVSLPDDAVCRWPEG